MSKRIDHEIRDAVLQGLTMGQEVVVHPKARSQWVEPQRGRVTGWSTGWGPDTIEVEIAHAFFDVYRYDLIPVEVYDAFLAWGEHVEVMA